MPRKCKCAIQSAEALKVARCSRTTVHYFEGFSPESIWRRYLTEGTRSRNRKTFLKYEHSMKKSLKKIEKKKRRSIAESSTKYRSSTQAILRAKAVGAAEYVRPEEKVLKNLKANEIASAFNIRSGITLRRYIRRLDSETSIEMVEDLPRTGRPKDITSEELRQKYLEYISSRIYHVTVRSVANWLKSIRGTGCTDSARKLVQALRCRRVRVNIKPKLQRKHTLSLFLYCWESLEE